MLAGGDAKILAGGMKDKDMRHSYEIIAKAKGSADNGKAVARRICIACHKFLGEGVEYGPDLMGVGARLKREDIIESIMEPNAKVDPSTQGVFLPRVEPEFPRSPLSDK